MQEVKVNNFMPQHRDWSYTYTYKHNNTSVNSEFNLTHNKFTTYIYFKTVTTLLPMFLFYFCFEEETNDLFCQDSVYSQYNFCVAKFKSFEITGCKINTLIIMVWEI